MVKNRLDRREHIHGTTGDPFECLGQPEDDAVVHWAPQVDQQVDVAARSEFAASCASEELRSSHPESSQHVKHGLLVRQVVGGAC